jgi:hypothetical protein
VSSRPHSDGFIPFSAPHRRLLFANVWVLARNRKCLNIPEHGMDSCNIFEALFRRRLPKSPGTLVFIEWTLALSEATHACA